MKTLIDRFIREDEGQNLIEYALLTGLIALVAVATIQTISTHLGAVWTSIKNSVNAIPAP